MAIGNVVQCGSSLYVYDEGGTQIGTIAMGANDRLLGYTSSTVSVWRASTIFTYGEKGNPLSTVFA